MLENKVFSEMVQLLGKLPLPYMFDLDHWSADFPVRGQIVNIFSFAAIYGFCCIFVIALKKKKKAQTNHLKMCFLEPSL